MGGIGWGNLTVREGLLQPLKTHAKHHVGECKQVVAMLVSEIVLCIKEVNKRTRIAAYELLVGLARSMHAANPPPVSADMDTSMGDLTSRYAMPTWPSNS